MKKSKKIKIVLDVNWFISGCINKASRSLLYYKILSHPDIEVFYSAELLAEFEDVINRRKFSKKIKAHQIIRITSLTLAFMTEVTIESVPEISRDSDDDYLLGICMSCKADFLITGDQDLLVLGEYQKTKIVTMGQFLQL